MPIDRRTLLVSGIVTSVGAALLSSTRGFAQAAAPGAGDFVELYANAKKEGEVTWYIAHWETEFAERVGKVFGETYPGVKCNVVRATSQVIYQRLTQDFKAGASNCDVFSSADSGQYVTLAEQKRLLAYAPKNLAFCAPVVRDYDPAHLVTITDSNPTVICYNTKLVQAADAPKKWTDFLDPKWANQVAVAHPGYSGAMGAWLVAMNNLYGWEFFEKLAKNKPFVGRSLADPPVTVSSGERKIGMSTVATPIRIADKGGAILPVYPEDGGILNVGPTAIIASSKHPNAAKLFLEFMLSQSVGELASGYYAIPVRTDVAPKKGIQPLGSLKGLRNDPVEISAKLPALVEKWRDTFGV
jgi:iron(III) transport system substrate-binding protein